MKQVNAKSQKARAKLPVLLQAQLCIREIHGASIWFQVSSKIFFSQAALFGQILLPDPTGGKTKIDQPTSGPFGDPGTAAAADGAFESHLSRAAGRRDGDENDDGLIMLKQRANDSSR